MKDKGIEIRVPGTAMLLATAILVAAKVWGGLPWPWWAVFLPLWLSVGIAILILLLVLGVLGVALVVAVFAWSRR